MKTMNHFTKLLALTAAGLAFTATAESLNTSASTTVVNSFSLVSTTALNFGDVRAIRGTGAALSAGATLKIPADPNDALVPSGLVAGAVISSLGGVQRGVFNITGAAPFTELTITFPTSDITLSADPAIVGPGAPTLAIDDAAGAWTAWILTGPRANTDYVDGAGTRLITTTAGAVSFQVGATLKTVETGAAAALSYPDAPYTGSYNLEVVY